jgi:very-short-patch-repair endonuclease
MKLTGPSSTIRKARSLRSTMSLPEVLLWKHLRQRPDDLRFRRQHPAGPYIADFFCADARLIVEIDGVGHGIGDQPAHDARRDAFLRANGVEVLRIDAVDVLRSIDDVLITIIATANARRPLHHASHGPPPPEEGEDLEILPLQGEVAAQPTEGAHYPRTRQWTI